MDASVLLIVCVDCLVAIVNGDFPENEARAGEILKGMDQWADEGYHLVDGDTDDQGFQWSGCDCCGSSLGGNRYNVTALPRR
jgi:hypothetical protein